ncbi:HAD family phosphatase [Micromonospora sp. Llam0]|uniref:HAD family hydrolase n=1 Tax=Micromonospora sp. Llam0 TaxID=2485143 RepID=UPI000F483015|nr:haloacid dehalogenase-like hydrolase [Micromonospora sp. Llam0]
MDALASACYPVSLGIDHLVGPDGRLTGEVRQPMIGAAKAAAVVHVIASLDLVAADCYAYGDHASDLEMLLQVGHPVVVGTDPVLLDHANRRGWRVLPADAGPAPAVDVRPDESRRTLAQPIGTAIPRSAE